MRSALTQGIGALALLSLWYFARYRDCTSFFFHFDDFWLLGDASQVRGVIDVLRPGRNHLVLYRPLSQIAYFWVLRQLFDYDAAPYHLAQLLAHVANAFLVYGLASAVLRSRLLGLGAALIYAAAPGHAIAVYWNALYSMTGTVSWYLAAMWIWIRGAAPGSRLGGRVRLPLTFALFVGALLSSEHGVTLPVSLALASLLVTGEEWQPTLRRLAPLFALAVAYAAAKVLYMRYGLEADYPDVMMRGVVAAAYQPVFAPLASLRLLGFYTGCAIGWLYDSSPDAAKWYGIGTLMVLLTLSSAWWARRSRAGRDVLFGLLFFVVALGPLLLLPGHPYSYYVGTAGAGLAIAVVAALRALPRGGSLAAAAAVVFVLAGELLVGEARARASEEFRFFHSFQSASLRWLQAVDGAARETPQVSAVVVPASALTEIVFAQGRAQHLLLGGDYEVPLSANIAAENPGPGRAVVARPPRWRHGVDYPGRQQRWDWLRGEDPWANG